MRGSGSVLPDTNVVLRYLLKDVTEQYAQVEKFFDDVRTGKTKAVMLESVRIREQSGLPRPAAVFAYSGRRRGGGRTGYPSARMGAVSPCTGDA